MTSIYVHGITGAATHRVPSVLTADRMEADAKSLAVWTVTPDRWLPGDMALITSRDGRAFPGEVADVCVTTGRVRVVLDGDDPRREHRNDNWR